MVAVKGDLICDFGEYVLMIEIDENRHPGYSCENKRLMQLSKDVGHRPILMIRFNPDSYKDDNGKRIASPWVYGKSNILRIGNNKQWELRLHKLKKTIKRRKKLFSGKTMDMIHLFF